MNDTNFVQRVYMSDEELTKMYMKMSKAELVKMLIACNKALELMEKPQYIQPNTWNKYYDCSDWAHCSNPFHDCINCPLMFNHGNGTNWTYTISSAGNIPDEKQKDIKNDEQDGR